VAIHTDYTERLFFGRIEASASDRSSGAPDRLTNSNGHLFSNGYVNGVAVRCPRTRFGAPDISERSPATASVRGSSGAPNWHYKGSVAPPVVQDLCHFLNGYFGWLGS
jgi:hypothetical protein